MNLGLAMFLLLGVLLILFGFVGETDSLTGLGFSILSFCFISSEGKKSKK